MGEQLIDGALPIASGQVGWALQAQAAALPAAGSAGFVGSEFMVVKLVVGESVASGITAQRSFHTVGGNGEFVD